MMRRLGLRARVTLAAVLVLFVSTVLLGGAGNILLRHTLESDANVVLEARADALVATTDVIDGRVVVRQGPLNNPLDEQAWVFTGDQQIAGPSRPNPATSAAIALAGVSSPTRRTVLNGTVRLLAKPAVDVPGVREQATVVVGLSTLPYAQTERRAIVGTSVFGLVVLLLGAAIAWRATGAALAPVGRMAHDAGEWSEHDLDRRFGMGPANDELTGLAATLDGLLGRIAASRRHEQRFSAEMAHEIRTPLAAVRGEAELLRRRADDPAAVIAGVDAVLGHADRMADVVEVLMRTAQAESDPGAGTGDALAAARRVVAAGVTRAGERGVALTVEGPDDLPAVGAPGDLVERALQPLVDNALRYAEHSIEVAVGSEGGEVWIAVEDDGPGIPTALAPTIWEPGVRGEDSDGVGLGLALSRRLVLSCHGRVDVAAPTAHGGARLELRLPALH